MNMKIKGLRWYIIGLIGVATIINYIDRTAINILWPYIHKDFGISEADSKDSLKLITTFFMIAYALGQTLTGKMMDAIGTRIGFLVSIIAWSISIALHAFSRTLASFNIFRFLLGLSEAGNWPGAAKKQCGMVSCKRKSYCTGNFWCRCFTGFSCFCTLHCLFIPGLWLENDFYRHWYFRNCLDHSMADH